MLRTTAAIRVGRLLEIRADAGYRSVAEVDAVFVQILEAIAPLGDGQYVAVIDWRKCPLMSPDAAAHMGQRISTLNARIVRSGTIASQGSPIAVLQFVRLIRDAGHPDRKLFFEREELVAWVSEVLTPTEAERLEAFLGT
jgi:hypothetical protein